LGHELFSNSAWASLTRNTLRLLIVLLVSFVFFLSTAFIISEDFFRKTQMKRTRRRIFCFLFFAPLKMGGRGVDFNLMPPLTAYGED